MPIFGILNEDLRTTDQNKMEKVLKILFSSVKMRRPVQNEEALKIVAARRLPCPFTPSERHAHNPRSYVVERWSFHLDFQAKCHQQQY